MQWTCRYCGFANELETLADRKVCEHCGREDPPDLPESDDRPYGVE